MRKIKYLLFLICLFLFRTNIFSQDVNYNCDINETDYVLIDTLMIENNLIDSERVREYFRYEKYQNPYLLITQNKEYEVFKISDAKNINFEQYNIFTGFFNSYGVCDIPSVLPVKFSLLFDKRNNQNITSIVQIIHIPYLKINCPQYFITVVIPKRYCDKICYTQKYIENEN